MNSNPLASASAKTLRRALKLRERIKALEHKLHAVLGGKAPAKSAPVPNATRRKRKRPMNAEVRARVSAAMKARWRKVNKAGRSSL